MIIIVYNLAMFRFLPWLTFRMPTLATVYTHYIFNKTQTDTADLTLNFMTITLSILLENIIMLMYAFLLK